MFHRYTFLHYFLALLLEGDPENSGRAVTALVKGQVFGVSEVKALNFNFVKFYKILQEIAVYTYFDWSDKYLKVYILIFLVYLISYILLNRMKQ